VVTPLHEAPSAPASSAPGHEIAEEVARLELLRRLSMGAAHTLNNAFTAILGETLCLLDERKGDPVVTEACALIQAEIERCARLTRSVALRVQRREYVLDETGMHSLMRGLEPLLRETVSRSIAIGCEPGDPAPCVRGASQDLELLVLLCAHDVVRGASSGSLRLAIEPAGAGHVDLVIELCGASSAAPEATSGDDAAWQALVGAATRALAERHGIALCATATATRLRLELASARP
jgi:C4-dicarboxylate-specific signal transduction histidine kinase